MEFNWPLPLAELHDDELTLLPWEHAATIPHVVEDLTETSRDQQMLQFTTVPSEYTPDMARAFLAAAGVRWALLVDNRYCGNIELRLMSHPSRAVDVGYSTAPWARSRGYMTRSLRLVREHAFSQGVFRIELRAATDNLASRRVAEAAGFTFEGVARGAELLPGAINELAVYSRLATDQYT